MPISGLILTLSDGAKFDQLVQNLHQSTGKLELGDLQGVHLPAVLETASPQESQAIHEWLLALPGVAGVDVVFVSTDDECQDDGKDQRP